MITFEDATELEAAMKLAAEHHHDYEKEFGADNDWAAWYANFIWVKLRVEELRPPEALKVDEYAAWAATKLAQLDLNGETAYATGTAAGS